MTELRRRFMDDMTLHGMAPTTELRAELLDTSRDPSDVRRKRVREHQDVHDCLRRCKRPT